MKTINWGILGCGKIAAKFAEALQSVEDAVLLAAGSRDASKALEFSKQWGFERSYGSYRELVSDPEIDVIYVATPHSYHYAHTMLCLEAGKNVLCEKPFTINVSQLKILKKLALEKQRFLMEALWSRFLPGLQKTKALIDEGTIGDPVTLEADFGIRFDYHPDHRLFNPVLGGGALLDLGIYPLFLGLYLFGKPDVLKAHSVLDNNGIDLTTSIITRTGNVMCNLNTTVLSNTPVIARIMGTEGMIELENRWFTPTNLVLKREGNEATIYRFPPPVNGYEYEIMETMHCLQNKQMESSLMPLDFSLLLMEQMDEIRKQAGIIYPGVIESTENPFGWNDI